MKSLILFLVLGSSIYAALSLDAALETVSKHGKLSVSGVNLVDQSGQKVQLKGMSLFWSVWMPQFYNQVAISNVHNLCHSNIVRIAMAVEYGGYLEDPNTQVALVETVIQAAIAEDIYVIVDWHDWNGEQHLEQAKQFFDYISKKYNQYPNIIYETYNEPIDVAWSSIVKPYHEAVIATIRANDPDNLIIVGTPHYDLELDQAAADPIVGQKNIMYTMHFYAADDAQWLRDRAQNVLNNGLPLFVTEYGVCSGTGNGTINAAESELFWTWLDQNNLSYVNWAVSDKEESASAFIPGTTAENACKDEYLSTSGKMVIPHNKA